ncbi:hypothetical protein BJ742DRAFT_842200 [Cladochytrium replicatum]|nr:hypothetical protein BJ742DRAFT_842200 [Cladochytrium replicatum]
MSLFDGEIVLLLGDRIERARLKVLRGILERNGGKAAAAFGPTVTRICSVLPPTDVLGKLRISKVPQTVDIVHPDWITASVQEGTLSTAHRTLVGQQNSELLSEDPTVILSDCETVSIPDDSETGENPFVVKRTFPPDLTPGSSQTSGKEHGRERTSPFALPNEVSGSSSFTVVPERSDSFLNTQPVFTSDTIDLSGNTTDEDLPPRKRAKIGSASSSPSTKRFVRNQQSWSCMHRNSHESKWRDDRNLNKDITDLFEKLVKRYEAEGDEWRLISYRKAIQALKRHPKKIMSGEEAGKIRGIGTQMAKKVEEIIVTGGLRKAEETPIELEHLAIFQGIYGVGPSIARKWYALGMRTLEDVKKRDKMGQIHLTHDQRVGLEHYEDFKVRIPRDEVTELGQRVIDEAARIDPTTLVFITGSYRRGAPDSGDIDLLICPAEDAHLRILGLLVARLKESNPPFLTDDLGSADDPTMYKGVCRLNQNSSHRRIDMLMVRREELGSALIHFTGNDVFNRSIRHLASKKGMRLSQHGLFQNVVRGKNRAKINEGERIAGATEEEVFEALCVPYRPPEERNA